MKDQYIRLTWDSFKAVIDAKGLAIQEIPLEGSLRLLAFDGPMKIDTIMHTDGAMPTEYADYQTNYQPNANKTLDPRDTDNSPLSRQKHTRSGWQYQHHAVEFTTGKLDSVYNCDFEGNDLGFASVKLYKPDGTEITDPADENLATLTVLSFEPTHDIEILGGNFFQNSPPASDIRLWVIAVPDVPKAFGGSKDFLQGGTNLKMVPLGAKVAADGRTAKMLTYVAGQGLTKFHTYVRHGAGVNHTGQMIFELFRP